VSSFPPGDDALAVTGETPVVGAEPARAGGRRLWSQLKANGLDLRNTWQVAAGAILLPLGVAVILLGWAGAAHGRVDQQQIPYLISGGILGLASVMVGCFFFWAHWLYRIYDQADLHHQAARREQAELTRALIEALQGRTPAASTFDEPAGSPNGARVAYVATPTGTNFHTPSCPIVASRLPTVRPVSAEEVATMKPCRICEPLLAH
jgi:hypothetical protein